MRYISRLTVYAEVLTSTQNLTYSNPPQTGSRNLLLSTSNTITKIRAIRDVSVNPAVMGCQRDPVKKWEGVNSRE